MQQPYAATDMMLNPNLDPYYLQAMGIGNFQLFNSQVD
jgi:hypothetical protein